MINKIYYSPRIINGLLLFTLLFLSFIAVSVFPQKTFAASASDDFNRADGSLGSNWTDFSVGGLTISNNEVIGTNGTGGNSGDMWKTNTFTNDQYSQVEVSSTQLSGTQWIGPAVRMQNNGQDGYIGIYYWNNGSPELMLFRESSGGWTQLGSSYNVSPLASGTQLKVEAVGSTISMLENGTTVISATDSTYTGGAPGVMAFQSPHADSWTGGDITYSVGGSVAGLLGTVVLQNKGGDDLSISSNGSFTFNTQLTLGTIYAVTVKTNPTGQNCNISNGSGTVSNTNVTNVTIICTVTSSSDDFNRADGSLGTNWTDITEGGLTISSNQVIGANGTNSLSGDSWSANTFTNDQYSQIEVSSTQLAGTQWIGPAVRMQSNGQEGYVGIYYWNNGSPELMLFRKNPGNGWTQLGSSYSVLPLSAGTQLKVTAVGSTISMLENGTTVISTTDSSYTGGAPGIMAFQSPYVDNWIGGSIIGTYAISGSVSGASGTVILQNNGSDDLSVSSNGSFTFNTLLSDSEAYNVTVMTNPTGQTCSVSNGSGTVSSANVTNILVTCTINGSAKSDNFDRANGSLGTNWTNFSDGGLTILSDKVAGGNSGISGNTWAADSFGDDQYSQVQVTSDLSGGQWIGPAVRIQNNGAQAYLGIYNWNYGSPKLMLFKRNVGTWTQLGSSYSVSSLPAGTQLQVKAVGSTISLLENGTTVISAVDSSYTGGAPGIISDGTSGTVDNWIGGDIDAMSCVTSATDGYCGPYTDNPQIVGANSDPTVDQNIWGSGGTNYVQTLHSNGPGDWYIMGSVSNNSSGAILTFPNTGFAMTGTVDGYSTTTSSFSTVFSHNTDTDAWAAYDLWFNDWADEVMIQTDISANSDYNCTAAATATFDDKPWHLCLFGSERVWKPGTDDTDLNNQASGTINIKSMLVWMENNGYLPTNSTWTAASYGFEVANTTGLNEKFQVNGFSFTAN